MIQHSERQSTVIQHSEWQSTVIQHSERQSTVRGAPTTSTFIASANEVPTDPMFFIEI